MKRKLESNPNVDNSELQKEVDKHKKTYDDFVAKYGEPKIKSKKK